MGPDGRRQEEAPPVRVVGLVLVEYALREWSIGARWPGEPGHHRLDRVDGLQQVEQSLALVSRGRARGASALLDALAGVDALRVVELGARRNLRVRRTGLCAQRAVLRVELGGVELHELVDQLVERRRGELTLLDPVAFDAPERREHQLLQHVHRPCRQRPFERLEDEHQARLDARAIGVVHQKLAHVEYGLIVVVVVATATPAAATARR